MEDRKITLLKAALDLLYDEGYSQTLPLIREIETELNKYKDLEEDKIIKRD
jgi:hypothetical protein